MKSRGLLSGALLAALCLAPQIAAAQTGTIRGKITNEVSGIPLVGAIISVGARSVQSGQGGEYVLTGVPAGTDTLRARLIGFSAAKKVVTVPAGGTVEADLTVAPMAVNLSEIVVTGYGEQRAGNITGAVTKVDAADFNTGRIVSPEELIRSKVPGVQVVDNNEPGGGFSIRIRGATSINAGNEPLIVIDGVPIGTGSGSGLSAGRNPLNFLNPNDIESVTVLRDASAAAIYGANAANGVLLITTKRGHTGTQFEYTGSMSSSSVTRLPNMLNAAQFRAAVTQYAPNNVSQLGTSNTDWFSLIDRTGFGHEQNLAVSGADATTNWRLSGGYLNQDGVIQGTTTERISIAANIQQLLLKDKLDIRANIRGSRAKDLFTPGGVLSNAAQFGPTQPVFDPANLATGYFEWPGNSIQSADNPVAALNLATDKGLTYRSIGNVQGAYQLPFLTGLKVNGNLAYDITRTDRQTFSPSTLHSQTKNGNGGNDFRANQSQSNATADAYLNYSRAIGSMLPGTLDLTGGYSYGWSHAEYPYYSCNGLSTNLLGGNGVTTCRSVTNVQDIQESKLISVFGRVNYNIHDKYLVAASIRHDGSSRFGPTHHWGNFPSASVGWRISEESFLKGQKLFSDLKIRGSWARTGNQAFANYQQFAAYLLGNDQAQAQFGNTFVPTIRPGAYNPDLKWEATNAYDVGLDFTILSQRINGTLDWYTKNTNDLLFTVPVPAGNNLSNFVTKNIGSMRNKGIELGLSARMIEPRGRGLSWTADFTASHNTNELVTINPNAVGASKILTGGIAGGVGTNIQVLQPGSPINSFYVYQQKYGTDGKPIYSTKDTDMYVDVNNDGKINENDRAPFHDPAPKWMLSHSSYFGYHGFDLSFTLRSYLGNYVYNNVASNLGTYSEVTRGSPYNLHASVLTTGFVTPQYFSSYYVEKASFLRMDNISLAYSFNYRRQPLRLFATVQNAFTITGYSGVDPTAGLNGIDNNIYPRARTFTGGLSFRF